MNEEETPLDPEEPTVPEEPTEEPEYFTDSLTDNELLNLMAVTLDDIKMLLVTLVMFYIIFKIVRW